MTPRIQLKNQAGEIVLQAFAAEVVDDTLAFLGYYAPDRLRPRILVDRLGQRWRLSQALPAGAFAVGLPEPLALAAPIVLEVA